MFDRASCDVVPQVTRPLDGRSRAKEAAMSTAKISRWGWLACLLVAASAVQAQNGLRVGKDAAAQEASWPRWQARFGLNVIASPIDSSTRWQLSAGQLLGDYYWGGLRPAGGVGHSGGFRATSGLLLGPRSLALGTPALGLPQGSGLTLSHNPWPLPGSGTALSTESWSALPYICGGLQRHFIARRLGLHGRSRAGWKHRWPARLARRRPGLPGRRRVVARTAACTRTPSRRRLRLLARWPVRLCGFAPPG